MFTTRYLHASNEITFKNPSNGRTQCRLGFSFTAQNTSNIVRAKPPTRNRHDADDFQC